MAGPFRSIRLPGIGPAVAQLPARSQITRLSVPALASSEPKPTEVISRNDASPELASPIPVSLAVQASETLSACQAPSAAAQETAGAVTSGALLPIPSVPAS